MVDFAGWEMPLLYTSVVEEHLHTRQAGSLFDVSHMGRIEFRGKDAERLLQRICTRQLGDMVPGQSRYSHVCNEQGGILDDVIVSRYDHHWMMVCNASNREKINAWLQQHSQDHDVSIDDKTEATVMVAVQGPIVIETLSKKLPVPIAELKRYRFLAGEIAQIPYTIFRSGYTGEDGVEVILPALIASQIGNFLVGMDENAIAVKPAGLAARDTLRMEAAMPLYGHELHEDIDTISAGQAWCVDLAKDFIGAEVLRRVAEQGPRKKLVGLELEGRRIARQHAAVRAGNDVVGDVTSGTFAPTVQKSIAMAFVESGFAEPGQSLTVDLGGKRADALVVKLPFYKLKR